MAARGEAQADVEVSTLVVPAWRLRWRAPELALVLGERAVALASTRRDEIDRLRAESLVIFASNRMGRGVRIADRALDALRASEKAGEQETSWRLRIELAACATAVGAPLTGFGAVRPVLAAEGVPNALRAAALVQASDCLVTIGRGPQLGMALSEADQLYVSDGLLDADTRLLQRGLLHASAAAQHRRWGDLQAATDAAGKGLELLAKLTDPTVDSGQVRGKLTLELVCALMDSNRLGEASEIGSPLLDLPVRAPSAGDVGWLRLALATRVHLPAGRVDIARGMLRDAADSAQRHQLDTLLAESLLALAHVHEVSGDLAEALTDLRSAHAAERRRARAVYAVRARLAAEFSGAHRQPVGPHEQLGSLLRPGDGRTASAQGAMRGSHPPADAVLAPELKQQLRQWRPVQAPKPQEAPRVKRALRAAEDMTVEGISAARAHAADRWRLVQPFGAADQDPAAEAAAQAGGRRRAEDREPTPDQHSADPQQPDGSAVPATGLIAAAGAMRSGRRRAAREAAEDDTTATPPPIEPLVPTPPWATTTPASAQPTAPEPQAADPDATPEVANVLDTLKAAGLLSKRRAGGRRRAPDADDDTAASTDQPTPATRTTEAASPLDQTSSTTHPAQSAPAAQSTSAADQPGPTPSTTLAPPEAQASPAAESQPDQRPAPETPKWRVEPPQRLRSDEDPPKPPNLFDAPTMVHPVVGADGHPVEHPSTGISAAFAKGPVIPTARTSRSTLPADPTPSSGLEAPRPPEPPSSTRRSTPDTPADTTADRHPHQPPARSGPPHIGPDFHLGADSLGRSGFRPASDPTRQPDQQQSANHPSANHHPTADTSQTTGTSQNPPTAAQNQQPPTPDFRLPSDAFGRSGFRTGTTPPAQPSLSQPSQTWPSDPTPDFAAGFDTGFDTTGHQTSAPHPTPQNQPPGTSPNGSAPPQNPDSHHGAGAQPSGLSGFPPAPNSGTRPGNDFRGGPDSSPLPTPDGFPSTPGNHQPGHDFRSTPTTGTQPDHAFHEGSASPLPGPDDFPQTPNSGSRSSSDFDETGASQASGSGGFPQSPNSGSRSGRDFDETGGSQASGSGGFPSGPNSGSRSSRGFDESGGSEASGSGGFPSGLTSGFRPGRGFDETGGLQASGSGGFPSASTSGSRSGHDFDETGASPASGLGGFAPDGSQPGYDFRETAASQGSSGFPSAPNPDFHPGDDFRGPGASQAPDSGSFPAASDSGFPPGRGFREGDGSPMSGPGGFPQAPDSGSRPGYDFHETGGSQGSGGFPSAPDSGSHPGQDFRAGTGGSPTPGSAGGFPETADSASPAAPDFSSPQGPTGSGSGFPGGADSGSSSGYDFGLHFRQGLTESTGGSDADDWTPGGYEADFDATALQSGSESDQEFDTTDSTPGWAPQSWATGSPRDWDSADADRRTADADHDSRTSAEPDYRSDFSRSLDHLSIPIPKPSRDPEPESEPDQVPYLPEPGQIPPIPDPDPIPQPAPIPMPPTSSGFDLGSRFLTSADVEDDLPDVPALPRRVPVEEPVVVDDPDPFVTAVVVGDRTIEVPSAARASRRHKSDLSLAELLTEALVAYETGRRSDPGADQTASEEIADWISSAETPVSPISPDRLERAGHHLAEPTAEPADDPADRPTDEVVDKSTASEKTTYLTPVRDLESTAPIWETGPDGEQRPPYDSWTLPES